MQLRITKFITILLFVVITLLLQTNHASAAAIVPTLEGYIYDQFGMPINGAEVQWEATCEYHRVTLCADPGSAPTSGQIAEQGIGCNPSCASRERKVVTKNYSEGNDATGGYYKFNKDQQFTCYHNPHWIRVTKLPNGMNGTCEQKDFNLYNEVDKYMVPTITCTLTIPPTEAPTPVPPADATPTPVPPQITALKINNKSTSQTNYQGTFGFIGNQSNQAGSNWTNPMTLQLEAKEGSVEITEFYLGVYDKSTGQITSESNFVNSMKAKMNNNSISGFFLAYGYKNRITPNTDDNSIPSDVPQFYLYNNGSWKNITQLRLQGYNIYLNNEVKPNNEIYIAFPGDFILTGTTARVNWSIEFKQAFYSKSMYTAGLVKDENGKSSFSQDLNPSR